MGIDFKYCESCEECRHPNFFYGSIDEWWQYGLCPDELYEYVKHNNSIEFCEHRYCEDCIPIRFEELWNKQLKTEEIIECLTKPWLYCELCKEERNN